MFPLRPFAVPPATICCSPCDHLLFSPRTFLLSFCHSYVCSSPTFQIGSAARYTLATLGRNGDIIVDGPNISRIQCSFEILPEYDVVMLYDECLVTKPRRSSLDAKRRVVIGERFNNIIGMGGTGCDQVQFEVVWHRANFKGKEEADHRIESPLQARTVDNVPTVVPSEIPTPDQWPPIQKPTIRHKALSVLGEGSFGIVYKVVDVDSGKTMAAKAISQPQNGFHAQQKDRLEREIFALSQSSHALDYLTCNGVIHRDVKPANILYTPLESAGSRFLYQLMDFGLCNSIDAARSIVGSPMYQAPEMQSQAGARQTCKVDIWSLFVTVAFALNVNQYMSRMLNLPAECVEVALQAARAPELQTIQDMTEIDPSKRPSAAQMLVKCYNGQGLTTPRNEIPIYPEDTLPMGFPTGFPSPQPPPCLAYVSPPAMLNAHGMGTDTDNGLQVPQRQIGAPNRTTSALGARSRPLPPTDSKRGPTQHGFPACLLGNGESPVHPG
ncbi:STE family protein kinase [Histoplasma capsulatum var. duboisii H88]|uniref:STE family protein kinase n=1 Tax=Ajellomyces capsulatus (strain H88) TaxID=544711 RepID=F0UHA3_AJEC8|nr:STE family protein kinase [Histoplasma capsulatum var. duboisii H88]